MRLVAYVLLHVAALVASVSPALAGGKVALVVGNADYAAAGRLENPPNDMRLVGDALGRSGFEVIAVRDAKLPQFRAAMRDFRGKALGADVAVVYFAGHGIEANGRNWLIPVDAKLESDFDLVDEAIDLDRVMEALDGAKVRVVVLDACRNNPFGRNWGSGRRTVTRGLAPVEADDVLVIYAAAPGQFAFDGTGSNSPFALSLAARLVEPGLPLQLLGGSVRDDVLAATGGKQRPFVSASMTGTPIYLLPRVETALARIEPQRPISQAPLGGGVDVAALIGECNRQAAFENDPTQPAGVAFEDILPPIAIGACRRALDASPDNAKVMRQLGRAYHSSKDFGQARIFYEQAAALGDGYGMNNLGKLYQNGEGVEQDYAQSSKWYESSAAQGNALGMHNLGLNYLDGLGKDQNSAEALKWFERSAAKGHISVMTTLGYLYESGKGVEKDYAQARRWYEQAANKGDRIAMSNLGTLYERGLGVAQDYGLARKWFELSAYKGDAVGMGNLGRLYHEGHGVTQNYAQARSWYEQAAAKGDGDSMSNLGILFEFGKGIGQDPVRARAWYEQAAAKGNVAAKEWLAQHPR